jgi:hypothetical protein
MTPRSGFLQGGEYGSIEANCYCVSGHRLLFTFWQGSGSYSIGRSVKPAWPKTGLEQGHCEAKVESTAFILGRHLPPEQNAARSSPAGRANLLNQNQFGVTAVCFWQMV